MMTPICDFLSTATAASLNRWYHLLVKKQSDLTVFNVTLGGPCRGGRGFQAGVDFLAASGCGEG
jgi:hypothetical protein